MKELCSITIKGCLHHVCVVQNGPYRKGGNVCSHMRANTSLYSLEDLGHGQQYGMALSNWDHACRQRDKNNKM